MTMPVVTFSIQVGSDGFNVAREVANELGYRYYDWQITSRAASLARLTTLDQTSNHLADRMLERLSAATMMEEEVPAGFIIPRPETLKQALHALSSEDYRLAIEEVVCQLAAQGEAVIVGHGSQAVLRDWPSVFKVLIRGSFDRRAQRLAMEQESDLHEAMRTVTELDLARREFFERVYRQDWLDSRLYDLTINTDRVATRSAVETIVTAASSGSWPKGSNIAFIKRFEAPNPFGRPETNGRGYEAVA